MPGAPPMRIARPPEERVQPRGVYASLITPRRDGEVEVDLAAMLETIDFVTSRGVNGIVLFGPNGEFTHFTCEERSRFNALATKRSRVPVLANVSHSTFDGTVALAEEAAGSGVAGVIALPPYFYRYDSESVRTFYLELAAQVAKWTAVYIHNAPGLTSGIAADDIRELLATGMFAGVIDSSGQEQEIASLSETVAGTSATVICGSDELFTRALRLGIPALVSDAASAVPELLAAMQRSWSASDPGAEARLQLRLEEFLVWTRRFPAPLCIRQACALRGVKTGGSAVPLGPALSAALKEFREWFRGWIQEVETECKPLAAR